MAVRRRYIYFLKCMDTCITIILKININNFQTFFCIIFPLQLLYHALSTKEL